MLTFLVLWLINTGHTTGAEISREYEKRKGTKPSPGTIYPLLKCLKGKGMIAETNKQYALTKKGERELLTARKEFQDLFYDMHDICDCH